MSSGDIAEKKHGRKPPPATLALAAPDPWAHYIDRVADAIIDRVAPLLAAQREPPEYRDDKQEAHRLGIGVHKLRELVTAGVVPCVHIGDRRRYLARDVDAALAARSKDAQP